MGRADDIYRRLHERMLELADPGEEVRSVVIGVYSRAFTQQTFAIGVTDQRLIFQQVTNTWKLKGEPFSIRPADLAAVEGYGMGGDTSFVMSGIANSAGSTLKIRTHDGRKLKLMVMGGDGVIGSTLATGEQRDGYDDLVTWLGTHDPARRRPAG